MAEKVQINLNPAAVTVMPGENAELTASIRNLGQTIDQLTLTVEGIGPEWYTLPVSSVALFPNDQDELRVIVHPPKTAGSKAGSLKFRIFVGSKENPGETAIAEGTIELKSMLKLKVEIAPERIAARKGVYEVTVTNPMNDDTPVTLDAVDPRRRLRYRLNPRQFLVPGGNRTGATLEARPGILAFFGGNQEFTFQVAAAQTQADAETAELSCPHCGRVLRRAPDAALSERGGVLKRGYTSVSRFVSDVVDALMGRRVAVPLFCTFCNQPLREDAVTASASFVATPWLQGLRERIRRLKLPKIRFPSLSRQPVIDTFRVSSEDKREFIIDWSVRRAKEVRLNDQEVGRKGKLTVRPTERTTYALLAANKAKTATRTIDVSPLPLPVERASDRIKAALSPGEIEVHAGGAPLTATLQVQNLSDIVDKFLVEMEGLDDSWCTRSASSVALMPQASDQVRLSFQPPKKQGVRAGDYPFAITVRSQSAPGEASTVVGKLTILPSREFRVEIRPKRIRSRRKGTFRIAVSNTGVSDITVSMQATDMEEGCNFRFGSEQLTLRAWDNVEIPLVAKPRRWGFVGQEKRYDITVTTSAADGPTQTGNSDLTHAPLFRSWKSLFRWARRIFILAAGGTLIYFIIRWGGGWSVLTHNPGDWWHELVDTVKGAFS